MRTNKKLHKFSSFVGVIRLFIDVVNYDLQYIDDGRNFDVNAAHKYFGELLKRRKQPLSRVKIVKQQRRRSTPNVPIIKQEMEVSFENTE